ncbi:MAG: ATP-binding protein, partial [Bacteroidota bacterium]
VDPDRIKERSALVAEIVETRVDGRPVTEQDLKALSPTAGGPRFRFATLQYAAPGERAYSYRLDGVDDGWQGPVERPVAVYPKLPAGDYTFRVRPVFGSEVQERTIQFSVLAPVWQRPWFLGLSVLLLVGMGWGTNALLTRAKIRELTVRRTIADTLHDSLGASLSGLAGQASALSYRAEAGLAAQLQAFETEARELSGELRDDMWVIDGENDSLHSLCLRVQRMASRLFPATRIVVHEGVGRDVPIRMETRQHVFYFCKEALHNAVRHGQADRVEVYVSVLMGHSVSSRSAEVRIEDDGIGFDLETVEAGRGLQSFERRRAELHGELRIASTPGAGTVLTLQFPLRRSLLSRRQALTKRLRRLNPFR